MKYCFIEFRVNNENRFERLRKFFYRLRDEKAYDRIDTSDSGWMQYFDREDLSHFWWPTEQELKEYEKMWQQAPLETRFSDPQLERPWDFESMIEAFSNGEYNLVSCEKISEDTAKIEFDPLSWPYGGSGAFVALIEAFGFNIVNEDV